MVPMDFPTPLWAVKLISIHGVFGASDTPYGVTVLIVGLGSPLPMAAGSEAAFSVMELALVDTRRMQSNR